MKNLRSPLPPREFVTSAQVNTLLSVLSTAANIWISAARNTDESGNIPKASLADGGAALAAEQTVVQTLSRLDAIVNDKTRWDMNTQDFLESLLAKMYAANTEVLQQTSYATALASSPHNRLRPVLIKHGDEWIAAHGTSSEPESFICGRGPTPHLAMLSFDEAYLNGPKGNVEIVADPPIEVIPESPKPKTKKRKRKTQ